MLDSAIAKKEYGDFQTPQHLANQVVSLVESLFGTPQLVIEPHAGMGNFLAASAECWKSGTEFCGYEINHEYANLARRRFRDVGIPIHCKDFFQEDWEQNLRVSGEQRVLVIGNPPWVTNADLGLLRSDNLPAKSNSANLRGLDAITGKSNFDIAEWMMIQLLESLPPNGAIAMLCKTITARRVLRHFWKRGTGFDGARLFHIDAKSEFGVSVDACLFYSTGQRSQSRTARTYSSLDIASESTNFGFVDGDLVSDIGTFNKLRHLDKGSGPYIWRSGLKHDAAKVMEFTLVNDTLINGLDEEVRIENDCVFPLLKSSDIGNGRTTNRKSVLVTQTSIAEDTASLRLRAPRTWNYLLGHAHALDNRQSRIYSNRPRFSVFGVGPYSFAPWKVAVSGLYKKIRFTVLSPKGGRPLMVDDTCYFLPCRSKAEAVLVQGLLSSPAAMQFLSSLVFLDAKRPVTVDILKRLSIEELARDCGRHDELLSLAQGRFAGNLQGQLF